jgi:hypothetical protein
MEPLEYSNKHDLLDYCGLLRLLFEVQPEIRVELASKRLSGPPPPPEPALQGPIVVERRKRVFS